MNKDTRSEPPVPAVGAQVERAVMPPQPERAACAHPNKVEKHFTYGYRMHCPDCKHSVDEWWD